MSRLSFSRQPTVWIGVLTAGCDIAASLGLAVSEALKAGLIGLITAIGAAITWTQVSPASLVQPIQPGVPLAEQVRQALAGYDQQMTAALESKQELLSLLPARPAGPPANVAEMPIGPEPAPPPAS